MPAIEILDRGWIDRRDSSFPQAVLLPNGDILCAFCVGGAAFATGGSDWARSTDGGSTWTVEGTILPMGTDPFSSSLLKLSASPDGAVIYAYGSRCYRRPGERFEDGAHNEPVLCRSTDGGRSWSDPEVIPMPADCPLEISHGLLPLSSGRLLCPAATLPAKDRLGEQVLVAISDDGGRSWDQHAVVFQDPEQRLGYFEQKLAEIAPGRLIAVCWTVTLETLEDQPDSFAISDDGGSTWGPARSTGIHGQTMTPVPLGGDRLLVLYNRRYGEQAIVAALVTFSEHAWTVHSEDTLYDAGGRHDRPDGGLDTSLDELHDFAFGFPTAIRLKDGTFLATHWCQEDRRFGIRWTKLRVDW